MAVHRADALTDLDVSRDHGDRILRRQDRLRRHDHPQRCETALVQRNLVIDEAAEDIERDNEAGLADLLGAVESGEEARAGEAMRVYLVRLRSSVETIHPDLFDEPVLWGGPRT